MIEKPIDCGDFVGDVWFGHPDHRTLGTHRWDGAKWVEMPDLSDSLIGLLAKSKRQIDEARAEIERLEKEVERLRGVVRKRTEEADDADYRAYTTWNDAIEAAEDTAYDWAQKHANKYAKYVDLRDSIRALKRS